MGKVKNKIVTRFGKNAVLSVYVSYNTFIKHVLMRLFGYVTNSKTIIMVLIALI